MDLSLIAPCGMNKADGHVKTAAVSFVFMEAIVPAAGKRNEMIPMQDFPEFMKSSKNRVSSTEQNTSDIEGYFYQGADDSQMAFWTAYADRISRKHTHPFDEYMVCISGQYIVYMNNEKYVLHPGDELLIPAETEQCGECIAGTRTIHAFGGKRIMRTTK